MAATRTCSRCGTEFEMSDLSKLEMEAQPVAFNAEKGGPQYACAECLLEDELKLAMKKLNSRNGGE